MSEQESRSSKDLPADEHLLEDVAPAAGEGQGPGEDSRFTPSQTNAGQQVAGLASPVGYGDNQDPDQDSNNPV